jgi:hypothetical protein
LQACCCFLWQSRSGLGCSLFIFVASPNPSIIRASQKCGFRSLRTWYVKILRKIDTSPTLYEHSAQVSHPCLYTERFTTLR